MKIYDEKGNYVEKGNVIKIFINQIVALEYFYDKYSDVDFEIIMSDKKKNISKKYSSIYGLLIKWLAKNINYIDSRDRVKLIGLSNIDYVFILSKEQMPVLSITKYKEMIPNEKVYLDSLDFLKPTFIELITSYELLGCFSIINDDYINEFKEKEIYELELNDGSKINIEELLNKKVIFICEELIEELSNNISNIKTDEELIKYFNISNSVYDLDEIRAFFKDLDLLKRFVFYHELGHAVFEPFEINDLVIRERQANYYASVCFEGKYDYAIEVFNNKIGKHYRNPLLLKNSDDINFENDLRKIYGEE